MPSIRSVLSELRRRKVYRAAVVYVAVAFLVWQVADIALPSLGLPDSAVALVLVLTALGFPVALVLAWAYELRPEEPEHPAIGPTVPTSPSEAPGPLPNSIAVLPFENMSPEAESEYFADGVSEELTHALGRVRALRVAARTSAFTLKGKREDVREIGRRLNVAHVVEGSVRRSGGRLRVTAQLIDTRDGYHVWSDRFEREQGDVFAIQDDIVAGVVERLLEKLNVGEAATLSAPGAMPVLTRTDDLDAYDLYLRGRHELRRFDGAALDAAVGLLERAIALDDSYAPAHAALAEALTTQALGFQQGGRNLLPRARHAAERAIALNPDLPAAHLARALSLMYHDWAFPEARAELEHAIRLNPSFADAHMWSEFYWTYVEADYERALASVDRAATLDPLDDRVRVRRATVSYLFGRYEEAEAILRKMMEGGQSAPIVGIALMDTLLRAGRADEAAEIARSMPTGEDLPDVLVGVTGVVLAGAGALEEARALQSLLEARSRSAHASPFWRANICLALGETDRGFELFDQAFAERDGGLLFVSVVPVPGYREDPRYVDLVRRMGLGHLLARRP